MEFDSFRLEGLSSLFHAMVYAILDALINAPKVKRSSGTYFHKIIQTVSFDEALTQVLTKDSRI